MSVIFLGSPIDSTQMVDSEVDIPNPEITRISLADAKSAFDTGKAIFVDVREKSIYDKGHIPGAKSIPLSEIEKRRGELDSRDWILLYCT